MVIPWRMRIVCNGKTLCCMTPVGYKWCYRGVQYVTLSRSWVCLSCFIFNVDGRKNIKLISNFRTMTSLISNGLVRTLAVQIRIEIYTWWCCCCCWYSFLGFMTTQAMTAMLIKEISPLTAHFRFMLFFLHYLQTMVISLFRTLEPLSSQKATHFSIINSHEQDQHTVRH